MDITFASFKQLRDAVLQKKLSVKEITNHFLQRIERLDPQLNAFITVNDKALKEAEHIDQNLDKYKDTQLLGIPFGIKDMLCTRDLKTTAGSKILQNFVPPYDATVVARIKQQGAVILGKLNQDEFAMGSSNETSYYGPVKNPWNTNCVPGGSSGGSAAAQAARLVAGAIGTDTGGSIRQPASFCGIVGVKPTYGRVSRYGIVAYASSLDQAGPMVSSVEDAALCLEVISGHDPLDSTTSQKKTPQYLAGLNSNVKGLKIGIIKEFQTSNLHADVQSSFEQSIEILKKSGADIIEVSIPQISLAVPVYYLVATSEASSNLSRYDGVKYGHRATFEKLSAESLEDFYKKTRGEGFGAEVKRRIVLGTYCLSSGYYDAYYNKASQVRRMLLQQYQNVFKQCDVLLSPVTTSPAFKIGERFSDPLTMYLNDIFTTATNLAGLPGMSVPFALSQEGLPIGIQVTAQHFDEQKMLNVAYALQIAAPFQFGTEKGKNPHVI